MALINETTAQMRAELAPVSEKLRHLIEGLHNWQRLPLSEEGQIDVGRVLSDHEQDATNVDAVILALNSLERVIGVLMQSGYPDIGKEPISEAVAAEITEIMAGLADAAGEFVPPAAKQAAVAKVDLGTPQPKPKGK